MILPLIYPVYPSLSPQNKQPHQVWEFGAVNRTSVIRICRHAKGIGHKRLSTSYFSRTRFRVNNTPLPIVPSSSSLTILLSCLHTHCDAQAIVSIYNRGTVDDVGSRKLSKTLALAPDSACNSLDWGIATGNCPFFLEQTGSACCGAGSICEVSGLCKVAGSTGVGDLIRGTCIDPSWASSECPQYCTGEFSYLYQASNGMLLG